MNRPIPFLFAFKFYVISSLVIVLLNTLTMAPYRFVNIPFLVYLQTSYIFNIFVSFYGETNLINGVFEIIFLFLWMASFLSNYEKKYSTVFVLFDIFLQNLILNFIFTIFGLLVLKIFLPHTNSQNELSPVSFYESAQNNTVLDWLASAMLSYGWFCICIIFSWKEAGLDPEGEINFCFVVQVKKKYLPWILFIMSVFTPRAICSIFAMIMGYYQSKSESNVVYKLPFPFYEKIESMLWESVKSREDFVSISSVSRLELQPKCSKVNYSLQQFSGFSERISGEPDVQNYKDVWKNKSFSPDEESEQIHNEQ